MNLHPKLNCEGGCKAIGSHTFVEEVTLKTRDGSVIGYEQIFSCDTCGGKRRYGYTAQCIVVRRGLEPVLEPPKLDPEPRERFGEDTIAHIKRELRIP